MRKILMMLLGLMLMVSVTHQTTAKVWRPGDQHEYVVSQSIDLPTVPTLETLDLFGFPPGINVLNYTYAEVTVNDFSIRKASDYRRQCYFTRKTKPTNIQNALTAQHRYRC